MAQILSNIENTFRQYMENFHTQQRKTANPSTESIDVNRPPPTAAAQATACDGTNPDPPRSQQSSQTLLEEITSTGTTIQSSANNITPPSGSVSLTLGIDDKVRAKIHAGDYIKFSSLLQSNLTTENDKYKSVVKDGQQLFLKSNEKESVKTIAKWMEAFHIFVAIYAEKHPPEISNLMAYAQIVKRISDACGDAAALTYDDKFRRWREKDPGSCPWQLKNVELYQ